MTVKKGNPRVTIRGKKGNKEKRRHPERSEGSSKIKEQIKKKQTTKEERSKEKGERK